MNSDEVKRDDGTSATRLEASTGRTPATLAAPKYRRRSVLQAIGGVTIVGLLAGCSSAGGDGGSNPNGDGGANSVDEWLANTGNYDGVVDRTDASSVTVEVGAQGNSGPNAFAPAAIEISVGAMVTWEWIDGYHNVVATDGEFDSGGAEQNATFQHTFESSGTYQYYCEPHRSLGMKGAVIVSGGGGEASETT